MYQYQGSLLVHVSRPCLRCLRYFTWVRVHVQLYSTVYRVRTRYLKNHRELQYTLCQPMPKDAPSCQIMLKSVHYAGRCWRGALCRKIMLASGRDPKTRTRNTSPSAPPSGSPPPRQRRQEHRAQSYRRVRTVRRSSPVLGFPTNAPILLTGDLI